MAKPRRKNKYPETTAKRRRPNRKKKEGRDRNFLKQPDRFIAQHKRLKITREEDHQSQEEVPGAVKVIPVSLLSELGHLLLQQMDGHRLISLLNHSLPLSPLSHARLTTTAMIQETRERLYASLRLC